jgi:heavy metal translocating P-type ATPase
MSALNDLSGTVAPLPSGRIDARSPSAEGGIETALAALRPWLALIAVLALAGGLAVRFLLNDPAAAGWIWTCGIVPILAALLLEIAVNLRRGEVGLDIVAALSMFGSIVVGEPLAGIVVGLMYAGGQYLEAFAQRRARREITALLGRVAQTALRYRDGRLEETAIAEIVPGDRLLIRHGEVVPVDGIAGGPAVIDQSALTGESVPVERGQGAEILSGTTSAGGSFDLTVVRPAAASAYARIVQLVEAAGRAKAPMTRLADRFAIYFLIATVMAAGVAWLISGEPRRALAVLVVATPCPLILAVPVAVVSGVSRCASFGLLVKGGAVLEALARIRVVVSDKTGTVTQGEAMLVSVEVSGALAEDEVLRLAASLDQASTHVVAAAIVAAAQHRSSRLSPPTNVGETPGRGIAGRVDGAWVVVGGPSFVAEQIDGAGELVGIGAAAPGTVQVAVAVDGQFVGSLVLADLVRPEARLTLDRLRRLGVRRIVLASGDSDPVARAVGSKLGVDAVVGDLPPEAKVDLVLAERRVGPVLMVGDGVNDAPALAASDVGVALGVRGAVASSEVADAVLLVDRIDPLADGMATAQRARAIALQSVVVGLGLSGLAMGVALLGYLPPVQGALVQEAIDVLVILNALRVAVPIHR